MKQVNICQAFETVLDTREELHRCLLNKHIWGSTFSNTQLEQSFYFSYHFFSQLFYSFLLLFLFENNLCIFWCSPQPFIPISPQQRTTQSISHQNFLLTQGEGWENGQEFALLDNTFLLYLIQVTEKEEFGEDAVSHHVAIWGSMRRHKLCRRPWEPRVT